MNKDQFLSMDIHIRASKVNDMLVGKDLSEVANAIGISSSAFSKEMQNGDYVYIKRENRYFHFLRGEKPHLDTQKGSTMDDTLKLIADNAEDLIALLQNYKGERVDLHPMVYDQTSKITTKSIRIRESVYQRFQTYCQEHFPYYTVQDLIAHCLVEFMEKKHTR